MPDDAARTQFDFSEAFVEEVDGARWRSATGPVGSSSGTSVLEVPAGCRLDRHTDSAEETIVVISGSAEVLIDGRSPGSVGAGGVAIVPAGAPHEVRNAGTEILRFAAVYASADVVTRYEHDVQPDGSRERRPLG